MASRGLLSAMFEGEKHLSASFNRAGFGDLLLFLPRKR